VKTPTIGNKITASFCSQIADFISAASHLMEYIDGWIWIIVSAADLAMGVCQNKKG
jgi:hypothetical protein